MCLCLCEHIGVFYYLKQSNEKIPELFYSFLIATGVQSQKNVLGLSKTCEEAKYFSGALVA